MKWTKKKRRISYYDYNYLLNKKEKWKNKKKFINISGQQLTSSSSIEKQNNIIHNSFTYRLISKKWKNEERVDDRLQYY